MKDIKFIKDEDFRKYTNKQKCEMPCYNAMNIEIHRLVLIHNKRKNGDWNTGSFFAFINDKGWFRLYDYDCWSICTEIENPAKVRYSILRGDFEYGGVNIFTFIDEHHTAHIEYGGTIVIKRK